MEQKSLGLSNVQVEDKKLPAPLPSGNAQKTSKQNKKKNYFHRAESAPKVQRKSLCMQPQRAETRLHRCLDTSFPGLKDAAAQRANPGLLPSQPVSQAPLEPGPRRSVTALSQMQASWPAGSPNPSKTPRHQDSKTGGTSLPGSGSRNLHPLSTWGTQDWVTRCPAQQFQRPSWEGERRASSGHPVQGRAEPRLGQEMVSSSREGSSPVSSSRLGAQRRVPR